MIESVNDGEFVDDFEDNIGSEEFMNFVKIAVDLTIHMVLNDPPIKLELVPWESRKTKATVLEKFEFWMYSKQDYYCIDGFPTEGMPGVVVLPPPYRAGYVYQGLKPAVIVLNNDNLEDEDVFQEGDKDNIMEHIKVKQEEMIEKLKAKRALSAMPRREISMEPIMASK